MWKEISRLEAEETVDQICKVPEDLLDFIDQIGSSMPEPLMILRGLNQNIALLEKDPMCDCGAPTCISAPQHESMLDAVAAQIDILQAARDEFREKVIDWAHEVHNCRCSPCQVLHLSVNAPNN